MDVAGFGNEGAARVVDEKGAEIKDAFFQFLKEYVRARHAPRPSCDSGKAVCI